MALGFFGVLHSWGRNLHFHPICTASFPPPEGTPGLSPDRKRWIAGRRRFFLPVKVLGKLFRRLFLEALDKACAQGQLQFFGDWRTE